jgi:copper resistance protein C
MNRFLARVTVLAISLLVVVGLSGDPAVAHTRLETSAPADGEVVTMTPEAVTLTFAEAVQAQFAHVAVTGPDGGSVDRGVVAVDGREVRQQVRIDTAGPHVIAYRMVAADGHPIGGQVSFTYTGPAGDAESSPTGPTGPPSAAVASGAAHDGSDTDGSWSFITMVVGVTAAAVGLQVLLVVLLVRRRRNGG